MPGCMQGLTLSHLETMPRGMSLALRQALQQCRSNPPAGLPLSSSILSAHCLIQGAWQPACWRAPSLCMQCVPAASRQHPVDQQLSTTPQRAFLFFWIKGPSSLHCTACVLQLPQCTVRGLQDGHRQRMCLWAGKTWLPHAQLHTYYRRAHKAPTPQLPANLLHGAVQRFPDRRLWSWEKSLVGLGDLRGGCPWWDMGYPADPPCHPPPCAPLFWVRVHNIPGPARERMMQRPVYDALIWACQVAGSYGLPGHCSMQHAYSAGRPALQYSVAIQPSQHASTCIAECSCACDWLSSGYHSAAFCLLLQAAGLMSAAECRHYSARTQPPHECHWRSPLGNGGRCSSSGQRFKCHTTWGV